MTNKIHLLNCVKAYSIENKVDQQVVLRIFMFELFLEKLSLSKYKSNFVLKGGFLISFLSKINLRTTMDLDITIQLLDLTEQKLINYINEIIQIKTKENLEMTIEDIATIKEDSHYSNFRISLLVQYIGLKERLKVDITTGDLITPNAIELEYKELLSEKTLNIQAYNLETIIAEKIETILSRGVINTRMRDFYDIYLLTGLYQYKINKSVLRSSFTATLKNRETFDQLYQNKSIILSVIETDNSMIKKWNQYQNKYSYAKEIKWKDVIYKINNILNEL